jgi:predicted ferric reductase
MSRFFDLTATATSLGQIFGLLGLALFSVNLILASRLKILDNFFYGLNVVYDYHRQIGALAFSLLLFHPLLLAVSYLQLSLLSAAQFFIPGYDLTITYGIISLSLMIILLGLTFYGALKYQNWKFTHKLMLVAFIFALLHVLYITSDVSRDPLLKVYLLGLGLVGLALGIYQAILSYFINRNLQYKITRVKQLDAGVVEIELEPWGRTMDFTAGQFVFVRFFSKKVRPEIHPFSLASSPDKPEVSLAIKSLGDFTNQLKNLEPGSAVSLEGPYGKFSHRDVANQNQIWIAGGIGITPFLSMIRGLDADDKYKIDFYYCVNNQTEAIFLPELKELARKIPGVAIIPWYSKERGYLTGQRVAEKSLSLKNCDIFLCGPENFMTSLKKQFRRLDVAAKNIHLEKFKFL